jgi:hypothetical protein
VDIQTVVAVLAYRISHNEAAYQSHRRRRLKTLAKLGEALIIRNVSL